ncbi:MAG: hypothetical protein NT062_07470 [Proteobacteria bacterium]|nr:hypothetical protein [Pseudomonadota bacterium]
MPKTVVELSEVLQVRVSRPALDKIKKAAGEKQQSVAEYVRQAVYRQAGIIKAAAR